MALEEKLKRRRKKKKENTGCFEKKSRLYKEKTVKSSNPSITRGAPLRDDERQELSRRAGWIFAARRGKFCHFRFKGRMGELP